MAYLSDELRQFAHPPEFRIGGPEWARVAEALADEAKALAAALALARAEADRVGTADGPSADDGLAEAPDPMESLAKLITRLGTGLWRAKKSMIDPGQTEPPSELRRTFRHVDSALCALADSGVEVHDHTGEVVPETGAYALGVLAFEPVEGLERETVIETVKPTVRIAGRTVQMGEVIVGKPDTGAQGGEE